MDHTPVYTVCEQKTELLNVKASGQRTDHVFKYR
jgi:hypothetical protein